MNRRAFLATLGALGTGAGCAAREEGASTDTGGRTATGATTSTSRSSGVSVPDRVDTAWPMPAADSGRSNYAPEAVGPTTPPTELWSVSFDASLSEPVVADGVVYVAGEDGVVRALDARTGTETWRASVGETAGTPWVVDDRLVVPTAGAVVALDADEGESVWRAETPTRSGFLAARHGVYYVALEGPVVVALDRTDGSHRWDAPVDDPWRPPLLASEDRVFVPTGSHWDEPWTFGVETGRFEGSRRPERGGSDMTAERFVLDGTVFGVDPMFGELQAATATTGYDATWHGRVDAYEPVALAGGADHLYVAAEHPEPVLYAVSLTDGSVRWQTSLPGPPVGRPAVATEAVLVRTREELRCLAPDDGSRRWTRAGDGLGASGSGLALVDDLVYATQAGTVRALRAESG